MVSRQKNKEICHGTDTQTLGKRARIPRGGGRQYGSSQK
jgi:hypothetical protein